MAYNDFDDLLNEYKSTISVAEGHANDGVNDVQTLISDSLDFLEDVESGAVDAEDSTRFQRIVDKVEKIFSQTADAINSELEDIGSDFYAVDDYVEELFLDAIRCEGFDTLADAVELDW